MLDLGGDGGKVFDGIFTNQSGIHRGATTDNEQALNGDEFARAEVEPREDGRASVEVDAAADGITDCFWLLKDFFKHVVLITAFFRGAW